MTAAGTGIGASPVYIPPLTLPNEFTAILILGANVDPLDIDPEQTIVMQAGQNGAFSIDPELTVTQLAVITTPVTPPPPPPVATSYTLAGPSTGYVGQMTADYVVVPNLPWTGTILLTPTGAAAAGLSPVEFVFASSDAPQGTAWTPTVAGELLVTSTSYGQLTDPPAIETTINSVITATSYTLTGPSTGYVGTTTGNFVVTPNAPWTGGITLTPTGAAAAGLSPVTLLFSDDDSPQSVAWVPTTAGQLVVTATNSGTLTNPSPITDTIGVSLGRRQLV